MRDDFTTKTKDILAKRVGYRCSNPHCKKLTIGAHEDEAKATSIGIAAHIKAASERGPRFDYTMETEQRVHINNGIWLCSNCATLIDKDEKAFTVELLNEWKETAEAETRAIILGDLSTDNKSDLKPYIETDLIWTGSSRRNRGFSAKKNYEKFGDNPIPAGAGVYIYWELGWQFKFVLHNNSSYPAYNIKIEELSDIKFSRLSSIAKVNNIPPYQSIDLEADYIDFVEDVHTVADEILKQTIPEQLEGLILRISYIDEDRGTHQTIVKIINGEIINE